MSVRIRRLRRLSVVVLLLLTTLVAGFPAQAGLPPAQDSQPREEAKVVTIQNTEDPALAQQMWSTREARLAAEPMPMPQLSPDEAAALAAAVTQEAATGEPGFAPGGAADPQAELEAMAQFPEAWALPPDEQQELEAFGLAAEAADTFGTAGVYTSYMGNLYGPMWRKPMYYTVGRLYSDTGIYCSASVISPNNIIVTAAHCVFDTLNDVWLSGWTFVPADRKGFAPYGTFRWSFATVLNAWIAAPSSSAAYPYDVAVIGLGNNAAGRPVTFYTGWFGRSWDLGYIQHHHAIGYPSNIRNGKYTVICAAESFRQSTDILGMGCDMQHGSSGGPWILRFAPMVRGAGVVNSVVSHGIPGPTWGNTFYGARFNSNNIVVLCTAAGC